MSLFRNRRYALVALAVMVAFVAIVIPTCRMIGCSMEMDMMGGMAHMDMNMGPALAAFDDACDGIYSVFGGAIGIVPSGLETLLMVIIAALFAGVMLLVSQTAGQLVPVRVADPPPPPHDPRGERLRV